MKIDSKFGIYIDKNGFPNNHRIQEEDNKVYVNFFNKKNEDGTFSIIIDNKEIKLSKEEVVDKLDVIYNRLLDVFYQFNVEKINKVNKQDITKCTFPEQFYSTYPSEYTSLRKLELVFNDYLKENNHTIINKVYYDKEVKVEKNLKELKELLEYLYVYQNIIFNNVNIFSNQNDKFKNLRENTIKSNIFQALKNIISEVYLNFESNELFQIKEQNSYFIDVKKDTLKINPEIEDFTINSNLVNPFEIESDRVHINKESLEGKYVFVRDELGFIEGTKYDKINVHVPIPNEIIKTRYDQELFVNLGDIRNSLGKKLKYYENNLEEASLSKDLVILSKNFKELLSTVYSLDLKDINTAREGDNPLIKEYLFLINNILEKNNQEKISIEYNKVDRENAIPKIIENHGNIIMSLTELENKDYMPIKSVLRSLMTNTFSEIRYDKVKDLSSQYFKIEIEEENKKERHYLLYETLNINDLLSNFNKIKEIELPKIPKNKRTLK